MQERIAAYRQAAWRGARWLLTQQNPDGSFVKPELQADVYHKAILALLLTGHAVEANRLLTWIAINDMMPGGRLRRFDESLGLYKTSWICQGAHRMGRFDISLPVMDYILSCQAPCGGFFQSPELKQYIEPVCSAWAGVAALYTGRMDAAARCAQAMIEMVRQQPDPRRFYFHMTPEGQLIIDEGAPFVDTSRVEQAYYCPGIIHQFLMRLYMATGEDQYLKVGRELFDFSLRCAADRYAYPTAGKSAVAAALMYQATGDIAARDAALEMGDYELANQSPEGWWANPHADDIITRLDHTAEFCVWLTDIAAALAARA